MDLNEIEQRLAQSGIENALHEARILREELQGEALAAAIERRCAGYPLQYLIGKWDFYRETYEVAECCLIPRADTEHLVEQTIKRLPAEGSFLDLCTGSGCVAISTLCARPDATAMAVDLFDDTLALAARNAKRNGVSDRLAFAKADVLSAPSHTWAGKQFDVIVSNPPYIRADVMPELQREVHHEPFAALCGGEDGLDFYRSIVEKWRPLLKTGGCFLFEIGYDQAQALTALGHAQGMAVEVFRDYGGNDRVVYLK